MMESGNYDLNHSVTNPNERETRSSVSSASPPSSPTKTDPPSSPMRHNAPRPPSPDENYHDRVDQEDSGAISPSLNKSSPISGISTPKMPNIKIKKQYSKIYRIRTKILQNLGKADKTTDEVFDEYESNFNKQQLNASRLHKEISNYLRCARALHGASKALYETLAEVYEPEWVGHDLLYVQAQNSDMIWTDFCHKLQDQSLGPLTAYTQDFPEIRKKIDKRGRKLVDYDSQRHQLENLQRSARRDEYKIARVKDQLDSARSTYETLNKELYDELPSIYDQRILNSANSLQTLFSAEATFMQESAKIAQEVEAIAEKLVKECERGTYNSRRGTPPRSSRPTSASTPSPTTQHGPAVWYAMSPPSDLPPKDPPKDSLKREKAPRRPPAVEKEVEVVREEQTEPEREREEGATTLSKPNVEEEQDALLPPQKLNGYPVLKDFEEREEEAFPPSLSSSSPLTPTEAPPLPPPDSPPSPSSQIPRKSKDSSSHNRSTISNAVTRSKEESGRSYEEIEFEDKKVNGTSPKANGDVMVPAGHLNKLEEIYDIPVGATTEGLPTGVLYKVRATYKYTREDVDELGFDVGEIIQVVEYEDPEEQEEGWLCGVKESSNEKGLFPANFTRPI